jgi:glycosyltransferase involved in cell wall biosynthesis
MKISLIFSFRNEEKNIPELVRRIHAVLLPIKDSSYELIFVNDCSNDKSVELLLDLKREFPIHILNMSRNFGGPACMFAGLEYASGDVCITMDSDLQDPPEIIPLMIEKYLEGYDVVHTVRTKRLGENPLKMFLTKMAYKLIKAISDIKITENSGEFRLMSRRSLVEIGKVLEFDPFFPSLTAWVGFNQYYLPYVRQPRHSGKSAFGVFSKGPLNHLLRALLSDSKIPLQFLFILGLISVLFSILIIIYAITSKLLGNSAYGISGALIAVALFGSLNAIGIGIIGLYLSRIYDQVKGRPRYILKDVQ